MACAICAVVCWATVLETKNKSTNGHNVAFLGAVGPILACFAVRATTRDAQPWSWPFHNESRWQFGVHLVGAVLFCVAPLWAFLFLAATA